MPKGMQAIYSYTFTGTTSQVFFDNIPQTYTDLLILISARATNAGSVDPIVLGFNNSTVGIISQIGFNADGTSTNYYKSAGNGYYSYNAATAAVGGGSPTGYFSNISIYIPNYASNSYKSIMSDSGYDTSAAAGVPVGMMGGLYKSNAPITSIRFIPYNGPGIASGFSITIYGIAR